MNCVYELVMILSTQVPVSISSWRKVGNVEERSWLTERSAWKGNDGKANYVG